MPKRAVLPLICALILTACCLVGCYPKAGPPPAELPQDRVAWASSRWPGATAASLGEGRAAFLAKCNGCHDYPDLAAIPEDKWPPIVARMAKKADLDAAKGDAILHWILASKHP